MVNHSGALDWKTKPTPRLPFERIPGAGLPPMKNYRQLEFPAMTFENPPRALVLAGFSAGGWAQTVDYGQICEKGTGGSNLMGVSGERPMAGPKRPSQHECVSGRDQVQDPAGGRTTGLRRWPALTFSA